MKRENVKEFLDGVDEEQLEMIISALSETSTRYDRQGMIMVAQKMRITAEKVRGIKKSREKDQTINILGRYEKEKTACSQQTA